jgi:hypothetical protein
MSSYVSPLVHSQLDWESILFVIPHLMRNPFPFVIPDLIGDPLPFEFPGFPIGTFGNDKFTVIPDLIGDPLFMKAMDSRFRGNDREGGE